MSGRAEKLVTSSPYRGQKDFLSVYQEYSSKGNGEDQTHHFAAHFALGVAGLSTANGIAVSKDRVGGSADRALGNRAYALGDFYRRNPTEIKNASSAIRSFICTPKKK